MLTILIISMCAIALIPMAATQSAAGQKKKANGPDTTGNGPDAKARELMQPGPEHQRQAKLAGTWDVACRFWMSPDEPVTETKGSITYTAIFDGRFLEGVFTSSMHGQPFTGHDIMGFDRVSKEHVSVWYDSMGTGITRLEGRASEDGRTITYTGEMSCPINGRVQLRKVESFVSDDRFTQVMYQLKDGKEQKTMELTYTRRQG